MENSNAGLKNNQLIVGIMDHHFLDPIGDILPESPDTTKIEIIFNNIGKAVYANTDVCYL